VCKNSVGFDHVTAPHYFSARYTFKINWFFWIMKVSLHRTLHWHSDPEKRLLCNSEFTLNAAQDCHHFLWLSFWNKITVSKYVFLKAVWRKLKDGRFWQSYESLGTPNIIVRLMFNHKTYISSHYCWWVMSELALLSKLPMNSLLHYGDMFFFTIDQNPFFQFLPNSWPLVSEKQVMP
jgi:hypothetical protein